MPFLADQLLGIHSRRDVSHANRPPREHPFGKEILARGTLLATTLPDADRQHGKRSNRL